MSAHQSLVEWRSSFFDGRDGSMKKRNKGGIMSSYPGNEGRYKGGLIYRKTIQERKKKEEHQHQHTTLGHIY